MRATWMATGILVAMTWTGVAEAVYTPNPAGRWAAGHFFLAGDFQYISDKDLDKPRREAEDVVGVFVRPGYTIARNVMLYGRLGFQDGDNFDTGFAGGFGIQGAYVLPRAPEWAIGGAFDFLYWDTETGPRDRRVDWVEFQFTPAVSYNIPQVPQLTPYAGFMLDFLAGDVDEDRPFGMVFGTNFDLPPRVRFDGQFRVISETGFFLSAGYLF